MLSLQRYIYQNLGKPGTMDSLNTMVNWTIIHSRKHCHAIWLVYIFILLWVVKSNSWSPVYQTNYTEVCVTRRGEVITIYTRGNKCKHINSLYLSWWSLHQSISSLDYNTYRHWNLGLTASVSNTRRTLDHISSWHSLLPIIDACLFGVILLLFITLR